MKKSFTIRFLSFLLAFVMVAGMIPVSAIHVHATENTETSESDATVVQTAATSLSSDDTDLTIDFNYSTGTGITSADEALLYEMNSKLTTTLPIDEELYYKNDTTLWRQVYDGDFSGDKGKSDTGGKLGELLESTDPEDKYIILMEDVKGWISHWDFDGFQITSDKVLDLNGFTLEMWDQRNKIDTADWDWWDGDSYAQSTTDSDHRSFMFQISNGATLTIIDSGATEQIITQDEDVIENVWKPMIGSKVETPDSHWYDREYYQVRDYIYTGTRTGKIMANARMLNPYKQDMLRYTHRDIFWVTDGNLVIYGGEFQAGRQVEQYKSNFSWDGLKEVIGQAVTLGVSIMNYATGVDAAVAADTDLNETIFNEEKAKKAAEAEKKKDGEDDGKGDAGGTDKKKGDDKNVTKDTKVDTPASAGTNGDKSKQKEQTVAQKQSEKNTKKENGETTKGDDKKENKANKDQTAKVDKNSRIAESEKKIAESVLNKDAITGMVDSAIALGEGIAGLIGNDVNSRITQSIQGTVVRVTNNSTFVSYGGTYKGYGSTPNVRNAVIETIVDPNSPVDTDGDGRIDGYTGGRVYIFDGLFEGNTGANVFNMTRTNRKPAFDIWQYTPEGDLVYTADVKLDLSETYEMEALAFENLDAYKKANGEGVELKPINTGNVLVRGGTFRCNYEVTNVAIIDESEIGTQNAEGDDVHFHKFTGTTGSVNLGVESFGADMIRDGRIQIVDVYGEGALVLLDGGEVIDDGTGNDLAGSADLEVSEADAEVRHYRLFCGDTELRYKPYLNVYPNTAVTNSTHSLRLQTYYGDGFDQDKAWYNDDDNIRAPYSSTENYFDFIYDVTNADTMYVMPQLDNTDVYGENYDTSDVWYYMLPTNSKGEPVPDFEFNDPTLLGYAGDYPYEEGGSVFADRQYMVSQRRIPKNVSNFWREKSLSDQAEADFGGSLYCIPQWNKQESYRTNLKWFKYQIYRVDPLSRENISESDTWGVDEPLAEVVYGTSGDSLKCKLPLKAMEQQIKKLRPDWEGYQTGDMYRIVFTVEEQVGFGYVNTESTAFYAHPSARLNGKLNKAVAQSSILFRCTTEAEAELGTYKDPQTGADKTREMPDYRALQWGDILLAGDYATIELMNGRTGQVDAQADKIFDVYYQWWETDKDGNEIKLIAGTDNVWVEKELTPDKEYHSPEFWVLNPETGLGVNGEIYRNTVDPSDPNASTYNPLNGLPENPDDWTPSQIHMYNKENTPVNDLKEPDRLGENLSMDNNNAYYGNTDRCYIPEDMVGRYIKVKCIVVNCKYATIYDNKQTFESETMMVLGDLSFENSTPAIPEADLETGVTDLGTITGTQKFRFDDIVLDETYLDEGYTLGTAISSYFNGERSGYTDDPAKGLTVYQPGTNTVTYEIALVSPSGEILGSRMHQFTVQIGLENLVTLYPTVTDEEREAGYTELGETFYDKSFYIAYPGLGAQLSAAGYTARTFLDVYKDGTFLETVEGATGVLPQYKPTEPGDYEIHCRAMILDPNGVKLQNFEHVYHLNYLGKDLGLKFYVNDTLIDDEDIWLEFEKNETYTMSVESAFPDREFKYALYTSSSVTPAATKNSATFTSSGGGNTYDYRFKVTDVASGYVEYTDWVTVEQVAAISVMSSSGTVTVANKGQYPVYVRTNGKGVTAQVYNADTGVLLGTAEAAIDNRYGKYVRTHIFNVDIMTEGTHNFEFRLTDASGNTLSKTVSVVYDTSYGYDVAAKFYPDGWSFTVWNPVVGPSSQGYIFALNDQISINFYGQWAANWDNTVPNSGVALYEDVAAEVEDFAGGEMTLHPGVDSVTYDYELYHYPNAAAFQSDPSSGMLVTSDADVEAGFSDDPYEIDFNVPESGESNEAAEEGFYVIKLTIHTLKGLKDNVCGLSSETFYGYYEVMRKNAAGSGHYHDYGFKIDDTSDTQHTWTCWCGDTWKADHEYSEWQNADTYLGVTGSHLEYRVCTADGMVPDVSGICGHVEFRAAYVQNVLINGGLTQIQLNPGQTEQLSAQVMFLQPATSVLGLANYSGNSEVTWTSNRPTLVSVDENGLLTAKAGATGTAIITCTSVAKDTSGAAVTATITVRVTCDHSSSVFIEGYEATCTATGHAACYMCEYCGKYSMDGSFTDTVAYNDRVLAKKDHVAAEEWSSDATGHWHGCEYGCSVKMDAVIAHTPNVENADCTTSKYCTECFYEIEAMHGHNIVHVDAATVTCTTDGCIEHYACSDCGAMFSDAEGTQPLNPLDVMVYSDGHVWKDATCASPKTCTVCSATEGSALAHSWNAATCSAPKTCTECGATSGSALAHTWEAATCTAPKTCSVCYATEGDPLAHNYSVATCAVGSTCVDCGWVGGETVEHTMALVAAVPATCTTKGTIEYWECSVCGMRYADEAGTEKLYEFDVPATGHNYVDGTCSTCGEADPDYGEPVTGSITLTGVTLSLEDEVLYNLYFTTSDMTVSADKMGLLVWDAEPTDATINGGATVIPGATVSGSTYMVQTEGIPGKNLGDNLYLVAYAQLDNGAYVYSKVLPYSAKSYCMSRLEKSSDAKLKALCVALLNYGASAQEYFAATSDYTYTTLMNADLTAEQQALIQAYNSSMMAPRGTVTAAKAGVFGTTNNGYSARSASMSADGIFSINYYFTTANATSNVTMYYWTEADFNAVSTLTTANATGSKKMTPTGTANQFWADIDGIAAKDLDKTIYACGIYTVGGTTYSTGVIPYSLGHYCSNKAEKGGDEIKPMAAATAVYSYYAKLYFNK